MLIVYAAAAVAVVVLILASLKGWQWVKSRGEQAATTIEQSYQQSGLPDDFRAVWTDSDAFVRAADRWWPYLVGDRKADIKPNPFFIPAIVTSVIILVFAILGGAALGGNNIWLGLLFACVMAIVQITQAVVSISGDKGTADAWQLQKADRSIGSWVLLTALLIVNVFASFVGSITVGSQVNTRANIEATSLRSQIAQRDRLDQRLAAIDRKLMASNEGMNAAAIRVKADSLKAEAIRESWRQYKGQTVDERLVQKGEYGKKCGTRCTTLAKKAAALQQLYVEVASKPDIKAQLAQLNERLSESGNVSEETSPIGARLEQMTAGAVSADDVGKNIITVFQILIVFLDFVLWLRVGDLLGRARATEYERRAELANAYLINNDQPPRYPRAQQSIAAPPMLPAPEPPDASGTVVVGVEMDVVGTITASPELSRIEALANNTLEPVEGRAITFGVLYRIYVETEKAKGAAKWMSQAAFNAALKRWCELRKHQQSGGKLLGFVLAATEPTADDDQLEAA